MLIATRMSGHGLGADVAVLDHLLVPFRGAPVYLRLVATRKRALDYAAGGFHVSVSRGQAGGCADAAALVSPTRITSCITKLGREDLGRAWAEAASKYMTAYQAAVAGQGLETVKTMLLDANATADAAYAMENVEPPRDPMTQMPEPPMAVRPSRLGLGVAAAVTGALAGIIGIVAARGVT